MEATIKKTFSDLIVEKKNLFEVLKTKHHKLKSHIILVLSHIFLYIYSNNL